MQQSNVGRTVRVVLQALNGADSVELATLEVDLAVQPLGAAAAIPPNKEVLIKSLRCNAFIIVVFKLLVILFISDQN